MARHDPSPLRFPFDGPPAPGELREVAPGVHWLRMPLPFKLDHINLWMLEDGDGWTLVDSGYPSEETRDLWQSILSGPAASRTAHRLLCTHFHPDHFGLSGWLCSEFALPLHMTQTEWLTGQMLRHLPNAEYTGAQAAHFRKHGLGSDRLEPLVKKGNAYAGRTAAFPTAYQRIRHGQVLAIGGNHWRVIVGEGHAPEHASLYCQELRVLIAGDQILPKITPNISTPWFSPQSSPLTDYLTSFERFADLPEDTLVLPSHRLPFYGLHDRIASIKAHHDDRLDLVRHRCSDQSCHAAELLMDLFGRELDDHHLTFAMGEAIAHLGHLEALGEIHSETGQDGVVRYRAR